MNILRKLLVPTFVCVLLGAGLALTGCAGMEAHQKETLLSAAGFRVRTPATPRQQEIYKSIPPYKMQRRTVNGKLIYAYADPKQGILYVGSQTEYQVYKGLANQQNLAEEQETTAVMNQQAAMDWGTWGPYGMWY